VGEPPRVSVLIVSFNTCQLTLEAIGSVVGESSVEIIVVDNASADDSARAISERFPSVRLIRSEINVGFAGGVNRAAQCARGAALLALNSDARLEPDALQRLLELLDSEPRAALVSPALFYPDGRPQASAFRFPGLMQVALDVHPIDRLMETRLNGRIHATRPTPIDHPLGACMLIRRAAWDDVGPLDEGYFMYMEEVDWCRRAHGRGWQVWYHPGARAIHHAAASTSQQPDAMFTRLWLARLRYYRRFHGPAYNRVVHFLVRVGLPRHRRADVARQLSA
jgi:N-acetylglucosaminyl-diphospho-decaprenol L-rhamnosyltransferase